MLQGFDTSHYNPLVSTGLAAGKSFWIGKVSQGTTFVDPLFQENRDWLLNTWPETVRGGYHYAGYTDAVSEANFFIDTFNPQPGEFTAIDVESPTIVGATLVDWVLAFANQVIARTGKAPWFYIDQSLGSAYDWSSVTSICGPWVAAPDVPVTSNASVPFEYIAQQTGTSNGVDQDVFFGTMEELIDYTIPQPTPPPVDSTPEPTPPVNPVPVDPTPPVTPPVTPTPPPQKPPVINSGGQGFLKSFIKWLKALIGKY